MMRYEEVAKLAVSTIRSLLTHGSNHISDSSRADFQHGYAIRAAVPILALLNFFCGTEPTHHVFFKLNFLALKKYGYGQCGELSQAAFVHLIEKQIYPLDFCNTTIGGHSLIVIGRAPNSRPDNINTWGDKAVICDVWTNQVYLVSDFRKMQKENENSQYNPEIYKMRGKEMPPFHLEGELSIEYSVKNLKEAKEFIKHIKISQVLMPFLNTKIETHKDLANDMVKMDEMLTALKKSILSNNMGALPGIRQAEECLKSLKVGLSNKEQDNDKSEEKKPAVAKFRR